MPDTFAPLAPAPLATRPTPEVARNVMKFMRERWECDRMRLRVMLDQVRAEPGYMKFNSDHVHIARQLDDMFQGIDNAITDAPMPEALASGGE